MGISHRGTPIHPFVPWAVDSKQVSPVSWRLKLFKHLFVGRDWGHWGLYVWFKVWQGFFRNLPDYPRYPSPSEIYANNRFWKIWPYIGMNNHFPFRAPVVKGCHFSDGRGELWGGVGHSFAWPYALILIKTPAVGRNLSGGENHGHWMPLAPFPIGGDTHTQVR